MNKIEEIEKLKSLLDSKVISKEQYDVLLNNLIGENKIKSKEKELLETGAISQEQYDILVNEQTDTAHTATSKPRLSNVNQGNKSHQLGDVFSFLKTRSNKVLTHLLEDEEPEPYSWKHEIMIWIGGTLFGLVMGLLLGWGWVVGLFMGLIFAFIITSVVARISRW